MKKILFKGCGTAIVTPFFKDGIDFASYENLLEIQIQEGVDAIIVCGTTGEASTMTLAEKKALIEFTVKVAKNRIPVIAGTGSNNTIDSIALTKFAEEIGVDGVLIVTPYYNKTTQDGLIAHYSEIAKNTDLPIILYNVPSRTGVNILPETCLELSKISNIVAIKEASGNISQVAEISHLCGDNLHIYSGNDDMILPVLSVGGLGVISVLSNIAPNYVHNIIKFFEQGNIPISTELQLKCLDLIKVLFCEVNPIPIKEALNLLGYSFGSPRLPLVPMSDKNREKLFNELKNFKDYLI
ncbi:MAG: 4-hydroxy-tetrahydrodipicolinate synthase [Clostridia bacterium]|nr:4-hydroxy-tetrahydrodipicolinate synthase [Clostridia bacterium]